MTNTTMKEMKATLNKLGKAYKPDGITTLEAGAMQEIGRASEAMTLTYQVMYAAGIRPTDYITYKNKASTASEEQFAERKRVVSMICYTAKERASLAAALPKDATDAQKASRKSLQDKVKDAMRTIQRGLTTQDNKENPKEKKANERKTAIESLADYLDKAIKLMQSDRPFPDTFDHDTACATLIAYKNTYTK